jgi:hypothetical protein
MVFYVIMHLVDMFCSGYISELSYFMNSFKVTQVFLITVFLVF